VKRISLGTMNRRRRSRESAEKRTLTNLHNELLAVFWPTDSDGTER
jgi:hypothetical protein